ncbi:MAG: Nif3-like dinuclear metal center hexameric protein [Alicyclobacillus sp.]|nr:Nif3-like dinuclear metal center hexameric protein [Alicyclobacillus sp.]
MPSIKDIIEKLTESVGHIENTVDTLKSGDELAQVTGIATTFMPTYSVLKRAAALGLNLVIAHEAPFYHHQDEVDILKDDAVYIAKRKLIQDAGLAIFRFHDHMHRRNPDQIVEGLIRELGWEAYVDEPCMKGILPLYVSPLTIPTMTVREVAEHLKKRLGVPYVRTVGDLSMSCSRVGLLPGYCGGGVIAIPYFQHANLDLVIVGEGPEWETPEYVRDAVALGQDKALIIVGHSSSEAAGMKALAESIKGMFPSVPVSFLAEESLFQVV